MLPTFVSSQFRIKIVGARKTFLEVECYLENTRDWTDPKVQDLCSIPTQIKPWIVEEKLTYVNISFFFRIRSSFRTSATVITTGRGSLSLKMSATSCLSSEVWF